MSLRVSSVQALDITGSSSVVGGAITGLSVNATSLRAQVITGSSSIVGGAITGSSVHALRVSASSITCGTLAAGSMMLNSFQAQAITGSSSIVGGVITGTSLNVVTGLRAQNITGTATIVGGAITGTSLNASSITCGTLAGGTITGTNLRAQNITGTSIAGGAITGVSVNATRVQAANVTSTSVINGSAINGSTIYGSTVSANVMYSNMIVSPVISTDGSVVRRYRPVILDAKNDGIVTPIPAPTIEGEMYVGLNMGRTNSNVDNSNNFTNAISTSVGTAYWVVEFAGSLFWGGSNQIVQTDYSYNIQNTISLSGNTYCCYVDTYNTRLYFGGDFTNVNMNACNYIAFLDSGLNVNAYTDNYGSNGLNSTVYSIRDGSYVFGSGGILVAGSFTGTSSGWTSLNRVAFGMPGNSWNTYASIDNGTVYDAVTLNNGNGTVMVIGGEFYNVYVNGNYCSHIVGWDFNSSNYMSIGHGSYGYSGFNGAFNGAVRCLEYVSAQNNLYVGGSFTNIAGEYRNYCAYFSVYDLANSQSYDFPVQCNSIYYASNTGVIWRGGNGYVGINTDVYNSSSMLSQGLTIEYKNAFYHRDGYNQTYFVSQSGSGGYKYEPVALPPPVMYTSWSSDTIISPNMTSVTAHGEGSTFTLIGTLLGGGPKWYIVSTYGCSFG